MPRNRADCNRSPRDLLLCWSSTARAQAPSAREVLEQAAAAMGGLAAPAEPRQPRHDRVRPIRQSAGRQRAVTGSARAVEVDRRARRRARFRSRERTRMNRDRRGSLFPFAIEQPWDRTSRVQSGRRGARSPVAGAARGARCRDAARPRQRRGRPHGRAVHDRGRTGRTLWLAVDPATKLPAWVRSIGPSTTLGDITTTTYFTGYLPFGDLELPVGITAAMDWRDTTSMMFHVDSYRVDVARLPEFPAPAAPPARRPPAPRRSDEDRRQGLGRAHRRQRRRRHRVRRSSRDVRGVQQRVRHVRAARPRRHARAR